MREGGKDKFSSKNYELNYKKTNLKSPTCRVKINRTITNLKDTGSDSLLLTSNIAIGRYEKVSIKTMAESTRKRNYNPLVDWDNIHQLLQISKKRENVVTNIKLGLDNRQNYLL
jgi:hypothetical protein